ncbi:MULTISPECIES: DUF4870 domain-containing protein [unclassified Luteimonas]|uniref:DUF4870 domain-containing protein n=1 Tax=unclassified Luteimonas TaxID=2629088 RepID=UPI0018F0D476|nr:MULTISPECIES: DUF4870 domain-containing protein [unclassified Luteimonas]MBJ6980442.1 DUF4870 domain-containing protein [Luteimonas sp. MC1572]MBJ7574289.1 DUF4870 domain-containing protein [Luteimonas sp. MC1828]QQO04322.1 DUF4870 domain-containing protein [Luteimonas sp. MC1572]
MQQTTHLASTPATGSERQWAALAHIAALVLALCTSWIAGVAGMLGAGAVYLLKRGDSSFVATHAREALNFNLSMFIYACIAFAIGVVLVGATVLTLGIGIILTAPAGLVLMVAMAAIALMWLVCSIIAAVKAWNGEAYRYPLTMRLF